MGRLFLDTARMGQPSPAAMNAIIDLSRYWAANGLCAEFDHFLQDGHTAASSFEEFKGLTSWHGVAELKQRLLACAGLGAGWKTLLSNRSSKLFEVPIRMLKKRKRGILCFQSLWPRYSKLLNTSHDNFFIFNDQAASDECTLVEGACQMYEAMECSAIVLPAVTHLGRVMPYVDIIELLMGCRRLDIAVVDGAQEFGHVPIQAIYDLPVFYLTCSQKWLRAGLTSGIAFVSPEIDWSETKDMVNQVDDPLLQFVCGSSAQDCYGETVAVSPLIALRAAINHLSPEQIKLNHRVRMANRRSLKTLLSVQEGLGVYRARSGMLTFGLGHNEPLPSAVIRHAFLDLGVVLSAFPGGRVRLSMPEARFTDDELFRIVDCFNAPTVRRSAHLPTSSSNDLA